MNSIVCLLSAFHLFQLIKPKVSFKPGDGFLISLGALTPVGDYILRLTLGERWFQTNGFIFHSFIYQGLLWFVIALLYWVRSRDIKSAARFFYPLAGLFLYALFTIFSTENILFFRPFSTAVIRLDWMNSGYSAPLVITLIFWLVLKLFKVSSLNASKLTLSLLALFILSGGIIRFNITHAVNRSFPALKKFDILPTDILQTNWKVIAYDKNKYLVLKYNLTEGWQDKAREKKAVNNFQLFQNVLIDPLIRSLYKRAFKNPSLNLTLQNELMNIEISELEDLSQLFWIQKINIIKNRSGQILDFGVKYRSIF